MKTVLVTPQIPIAYESGGIGTFIWHFSKLLRRAGDDVHIILTYPPARPAKVYCPPFEELGIPVTTILEYGATIDLVPGTNLDTRISEMVVELLPSDTDVVYFADWKANGFHFVRRRRFQRDKLPVAVTVLHGNSKWHRQGMHLFPSSGEEIAQDYRESYVAEYSDFVVSPSEYMLGWAGANDWKLPPNERVRPLGYPFFPDPRIRAATEQHADKFERIVFYGRLDKRKGIDLFVDCLDELADHPCLESIKEVVLLGGRGPDGTPQPNDWAQIVHDKLPNVTAIARSNLTSVEAQSYLAENVHNTLVVVPSRSETAGFTVIESSLIPGLNLICSNVGGIPEVLGEKGKDQLFEPFVRPMAKKMEEWLLTGPRDASRMGRYDWETANRRWMDFHQEACDFSRAVRCKREMRQSPVVAGSGVAPEQKSVDICVPYYNLGKYLPYLLESLDQQTCQDFNLFVINDGSSDPASIAVFDQMRRRYQDKKHWQFISTENQGVCEARNLAASLGTAEFICFLDADNIAAPNLVERFLEGLRLSGDECLTSYMYVFKGEGWHYRSRGGLQPCVYEYAPVGNCLSLGIFDNPFGDGNCMLRRSAFEAIGGFTNDYPRQINHEDRELLTRLAIAGYRLDVIPEFLFFYRYREDSRLRTTEDFQNERRVMRHYEDRLREIGLADLAPLVTGFHYRWQAASVAPPSNSLNYLVYRVSGYAIVKALAVKVRNQIAKRLGRPLIP